MLKHLLTRRLVSRRLARRDRDNPRPACPAGYRSLCPRRSPRARPLVVEALEERTLLSYNFTMIADTSGAFGDVSRFFPSINSQGAVAFEANLKAGGEAIFTGSGGELSRIAVTGDFIGSFTLAPKINSAGTVAFGADLTAGGRAIFTGRGGELTRIADTTTGPFSG